MRAFYTEQALTQGSFKTLRNNFGAKAYRRNYSCRGRSKTENSYGSQRNTIEQKETS